MDNKTYSKTLLFTLFFSLFIYSCSSTRSLYYYVDVDSKIDMPLENKKIGIINRTLPVQKKGAAGIIDELISQEGFKIDKKAAETSVVEMANEFSRNQYEPIIIDSLFDKNTNLIQRPEPLTWDNVKLICEANNVETLVVLEFLDTRSTFTQSSIPTTVTLPGGNTVNANKYNVSINTELDAFWRIYDLKNKRILDENPIKTNISSTGNGISLIAAFQAINNREQEVLERCKDITTSYGSTLFPRKQQVYTSYYTKGSHNLVKASRMVETKNLDGALKLWQSETSNEEVIKGRSLYNQAVGYDFLHESDTALTLARKSYEEYGIKKGKYLANSIQRRTTKQVTF
jgi:hypothetical protein